MCCATLGRQREESTDWNTVLHSEFLVSTRCASQSQSTSLLAERRLQGEPKVRARKGGLPYCEVRGYPDYSEPESLRWALPLQPGWAIIKRARCGHLPCGTPRNVPLRGLSLAAERVWSQRPLRDLSVAKEREWPQRHSAQASQKPGLCA